MCKCALKYIGCQICLCDHGLSLLFCGAKRLIQKNVLANFFLHLLLSQHTSIWYVFRVLQNIHFLDTKPIFFLKIHKIVTFQKRIFFFFNRLNNIFYWVFFVVLWMEGVNLVWHHNCRQKQFSIEKHWKKASIANVFSAFACGLNS